MLGYLRHELKAKTISKKQYIAGVKGVEELSKKIDLGTHFQRHRKKLGTFHYSLYPHKNQCFQMDLMDLSSYAKDNRGYKWILIFINTQTKYLRIHLMKSKTGKETSKALHEILKTITDLKKDDYRILIQCDDGNEFFNKDVKNMITSFNTSIKLYSTTSKHKAAFAESVIRTIRAPLVRSMEDNGPSWINQLPGIVHNYNHTTHSTIKMTPFQAEEDFPAALTNIHNRYTNSKKRPPPSPKFNKGEYVRIFAGSAKNHFRKGSLRKWTAEVFIVREVRKLKTKYVYKLKNVKDGAIDEIFDENDLQAASTQSTYKFHILKTRKRGGEVEHYVQWDGFPSSEISWIKKSDLV